MGQTVNPRMQIALTALADFETIFDHEGDVKRQNQCHHWIRRQFYTENRLSNRKNLNFISSYLRGIFWAIGAIGSAPPGRPAP